MRLGAVLGVAVAAFAAASAWAGPISGLVGVGTWNTQAEFKDVVVTRGSQTLYQSDFTSGLSGFVPQNGTWSVAGGILRQTGAATPALALVGSSTWNSYTVSLKARKTGGAEGFLVAFGSPGDTTKTWWNIGGWGNTLHALEAPGVSAPSVPGTIATGRWYDIRVEARGIDIRCYLDDVLVHDTARLLDGTDRTVRFNALLANTPGYRLLNAQEKLRLARLAGRSVYVGGAARATFHDVPSGLTFAQMDAQSQAAALRAVMRRQMTWSLGWGFDGIDEARRNAIINSMDSAVSLYNSLGIFEKHLTANNSPGTPTADANYDGQIRFGGQFNARVALHEIGHTQGVGTIGAWGQHMVNGSWNGYYGNSQLSKWDGPGAVIHGDAIHFWPYGLNYDNESSPENDRRHVLLVGAMRRDMGVATHDVTGTTAVTDGLYRLAPRLAPSSSLDVAGGSPAAGSPLAINRAGPAVSQRFHLDLQDDGTYVIRTALEGHRAVGLATGAADNGVALQLADPDGTIGQKWYLIPAWDNTYRLAPAANAFRCADILNVSPNDGTPVIVYDYWDGAGQQWTLTRLAAGYTTEELAQALRTAGGLLAASASSMTRLDPVKDEAGAVELRDAVAIARKVAGLDVNP